MAEIYLGGRNPVIMSAQLAAEDEVALGACAELHRKLAQRQSVLRAPLPGTIGTAMARAPRRSGTPPGSGTRRGNSALYFAQSRGHQGALGGAGIAANAAAKIRMEIAAIVIVAA